MQTDMHPVLKSYLPIVKGLAQTFGKNFEIVLHDVSKTESSIIAIENGHITNRVIGSPATDLLMDLINKNREKDQNMELNYITRTEDGKELKSSTFLIRDRNSDIIGAMCINIDLTNIRVTQGFLDEITRVEKENEPIENFPQDAGNFLNLMIRNSLKEVNKPIPQLSKDDRLRIVSYLDKNNIFDIKGAVEILAKELNCSRYTIYNYLDEIRAKIVNE